MRAITEAAAPTLEWLEPRAAENLFELRDGAGELYATLDFKTAFGTLAFAETAHGRWSFKRVGFLNAAVTVRAEGASENLAVFQPKFFGGGELAFPDGGVALWQTGNFWQTEWAFLDSRRQPLARFGPGPKAGLSGLFKTQATVTVERSALAAERLALLVTLGFYLVVLHRHDSSTVALMVTVS